MDGAAARKTPHVSPFGLALSLAASPAVFGGIPVAPNMVARCLVAPVAGVPAPDLSAAAIADLSDSAVAEVSQGIAASPSGMGTEGLSATALSRLETASAVVIPEDTTPEGAQALASEQLGEMSAPGVVPPSPKEISLQTARRFLRIDRGSEPSFHASLIAGELEMGRDVPQSRIDAFLAMATSVDEILLRNSPKALETVFAALIDRGLDVSLSPLEAMLEASDFFVRNNAIEALGKLCAACLRRGMDMHSRVAKMEALAVDKSLTTINFQPTTAVWGLGLIYAELVKRGEDVLEKVLALCRHPDYCVYKAAVVILGDVCAEMIRQGKRFTPARIDAMFGRNPNVRWEMLEGKGKVYAAMVEEGLAIPLEEIEAMLSSGDLFVRRGAASILGEVYPALIRRGRDISLEFLIEAAEHDTDKIVNLEAIKALANVYAAMIREERPIVTAPLEAVNPRSPDMRDYLSGSLARVNAVLAENGRDASASRIEEILGSRHNDIRREAIEALGLLYPAMIRGGKSVSLERLEAMSADPDADVRAEAARALGVAYAEMAKSKRFFLLPLEKKKVELWREANLPFEKTLIDQYLDAPNAPDFIRELRSRADLIVRNGFDPKNEEQKTLAFIGLRGQGFNLERNEFEERLKSLLEYDRRHPGSFRALFTKTKNMPFLTVNGRGVHVDYGRVDVSVLDRHVRELYDAERRILSLDWTMNFPDEKGFSLRDLYYQLRKRNALESGSLAAGERFHVAYPPEEVMRREILSDRAAYLRLVFASALRKHQGRPSSSDKLLALMRDLIFAAALSDPGLKRELESRDLETRVAAFKNLYGDYINHLPDSLGLRIAAIRGLGETLARFAAAADAELGKARLLEGQESDSYDLAPLGFAGVFRGRCGILDCSFDKDGQGTQPKGTAFTRAMHEDTIYYGVYKGDRAKGYVGMLVGRTKDGKKVLTIDTINSPSLDGVELLTDLFRQLSMLAKKLGCVGIALPEEMDGAFNFDNDKTIKDMAVYQNARKIEVTPVHSRSWNAFTKEYGKDKYNSIESGKFRLLNVD